MGLMTDTSSNSLTPSACLSFCLLLALLVVSKIDETTCFVIAPTSSTAHPATTICNRVASPLSSLLLAKKKRNNNQAGKGFGKEPNKVDKSSGRGGGGDLFTLRTPQPSQQQQESSQFTSIEGGSDAIPTLSMEETVVVENVEDRTGNILREKYGLRTREEQEAAEQRQKQIQEQRSKINEWKKLADEGEDFDLLEVLPDPVLIFIDRFLKIGVAISTTLFVLAGLAITVEAGSKVTDNPLPAGIDDFIANVIEPNFTPGLGVLLFFSVGLGLFASLQLNSAASTYREEK